MDNNSLGDILQSFTNMDEYAKYIMDVEYQFYSADNDAEALRLSIEAQKKGHSHCLFDYVIGFCFNNGRGGVQVDKRRAGQYFFASAEAHDVNGNYYNDKHSDESRAILAEDYVLHDNIYGVIDVAKTIDYCNTLLSHERSVDDALLYLTFIYGQPQFGCLDIDKAIGYCNEILKSSDADHRQRAIAIRQALETSRPKQKKSLFGGLFGKH